MMRLLLALSSEGGYFRPLAGHPTLAQALWATVRELRMAGLAPDTLTPAAFASPAKHAEFVALLRAYEQFLSDRKRADMATVYQEAVRHPDWCPIQLRDCWTELPDANWNPLQRTLLDSLPGERMEPRAFALAGIDIPRRLKLRPTLRVRPDVATNSLAFLMTPPLEAPSQVGIDLFHAGGREAEIEEVFRRILATGAPLDQVEIACASDAHVGLVWEKALRHDWPVTLGTGIPATFTRPGRALIGLCDWIETDFAAGYFRRLLRARPPARWRVRKLVGDAPRTPWHSRAWSRATRPAPPSPMWPTTTEPTPRSGRSKRRGFAPGSRRWWTPSLRR
jgi:ATP-dependent helicase/nuclease subunit B